MCITSIDVTMMTDHCIAGETDYDLMEKLDIDSGRWLIGATRKTGQLPYHTREQALSYACEQALKWQQAYPLYAHRISVAQMFYCSGEFIDEIFPHSCWLQYAVTTPS